MSATHEMTPAQERGLTRVAVDLHERYKGVFGVETIESLVKDSFERLVATSRASNFLIVSAERFTRERLDALVQAEDKTEKKRPGVLFLCVHNAGRSQMALGWFTRLAQDHAVAWSGGSAPASEVNRNVVAAMAEVGIDISQEFPKPWTDEFLGAADVVVTMGCGDSCPLVPGKHYEDWEVVDPSERSLEEIRLIRDDIRQRTQELLGRLGIAVE